MPRSRIGTSSKYVSSALTDDPALMLCINSHAFCAARLLHRDEEMRAQEPQLGQGMEHVPRALHHRRLASGLRDPPRRPRAGQGRSCRDELPSGAGGIWDVHGLCRRGVRARWRRGRMSSTPALFEPRAGGTRRQQHPGHLGGTGLTGPRDPGQRSRGSCVRRGPAARRSRARERAGPPDVGGAASLRFLGRVLLRSGRLPDAAIQLQSAAKLADDLGMPGLVLRARAAAPTLEGPRSSRTSSAAPSTNAEVATAPVTMAREGDIWRVEHGGRASA